MRLLLVLITDDASDLASSSTCLLDVRVERFLGTATGESLATLTDPGEFWSTVRDRLRVVGVPMTAGEV